MLTCAPCRYWRRTLGLQVRYADCGGYRFCYAYRGKAGMRPSILMLHGFSAHKDAWLTVVKVHQQVSLFKTDEDAEKTLKVSVVKSHISMYVHSHVLTKYLPKHLHILCVDMPGHEGTTRTNTDDYSIMGQVKRIHQVNRSQPRQWSVRLLMCGMKHFTEQPFPSSVCGGHSLKQETFSRGWNLNGRKRGRGLRGLLPLGDLQHDSHLSRRSVSKSAHACVSVSNTKDKVALWEIQNNGMEICVCAALTVLLESSTLDSESFVSVDL